jgi:23S rRNA (cytosine1962-C5)-methyltransferase
MDLDSTSAHPLAAARVWLKPRRALPFYGRHPWVLASAIDRVEVLNAPGTSADTTDGESVELLNDKGKFIARGIYNSQSRIAVRLYSWAAEQPIDEAFFQRRLESAIALRRQLGYETDGAARAENACRLVFSESDGLSGLVVDRYGDWLVIQPTSLGIAQRLPAITPVLQELLSSRVVVIRYDKAMAELESFEPPETQISGPLPDGPLTIREHAIAYEVDLHGGQKTGFYLDQRENRLAAARYANGRRVLDMFCYTGGFALTAAAIGKAKEVLAVDGSKKAIAQAQRNAEINSLANVQFECADAFRKLDALLSVGERFDMVILDPPKFARGRGGAEQALRAYHRLNRTAVELLVPGGVLVTCSCTGGVSREDFLLMLSGVSQKSGRDVRILEQRGAAPDHPVLATCLETDYLKCVICDIR